MAIDTEKLLLLNELICGKYDKTNAGEKIFGTLKKLVNFENGGIFYFNNEDLNPIYLYNLENSEFKKDQIDGLKGFKLSETLVVNDCPHSTPITDFTFVFLILLSRLVEQRFLLKVTCKHG